MAKWAGWTVVPLLFVGIAVGGTRTTFASVSFARASAVSPATGARYAASWSCAGGQVRILVQKGEGHVDVRYRSEPAAGDQGWHEDLLASYTGSFEIEPSVHTENDNATTTGVMVQDRSNQSAGWTDVLELAVPKCPDYSVGTGSVFQSIAPKRVLDTRADSAINYTGPKPVPGSTVQIPATAFPGLPANATAVSVTVTGTEATGPGFLQALPTGGADPGSSSNVNLPAPGSTVANLAVVPLGADRSITVLTSAGAHLIVDVNGYFVAAGASPTAGRLVTTEQRRMLDTRPATSIGYSGSQPNGSILTVDLAANGSGLPAGASAAVVNITATESIGAGYVQAAASGALVPGASSVLNLTGAQQTVAGLSIVPVSTSGAIDLYTSSGTHLIVDLIGWFTGPTATASTSGLFVPLAPERIYDTRLDSMLNIGFSWTTKGIHDDVIHLPGMNQVMGAVFINGTATDNEAPGFVTYGGYNPAKPTSNLNLSSAQTTVANAAIVSSTGDVPITASIYTQSVIDLAGYFTK